MKNTNVVKVNEMAMVDEDLIPIEERTTTEVVVTGLSLPQNNLEALVPEDERGFDEPEEEADVYAEAERQGYVSPVSRMARIDSSLDGQIYACIEVNDEGARTVVFCQKYGDGRFSAKMYLEQSDLLLYTVSLKTKEKSMKAKATAILTKTYKDYFGKFDGDTVLDMADVMKALMSVLMQLPVYRNNIDVVGNPSMLYREIMNCIQGKNREFTMPSGFCEERKSYYGLVDEQIDALARHFGMKRLSFLKRLNECGFLYLTDSSQGYQTKVRFPARDGFPASTDWLYCIWRLDYFAQKKELAEPENP